MDSAIEAVATEMGGVLSCERLAWGWGFSWVMEMAISIGLNQWPSAIALLGTGKPCHHSQEA